MTDVQSSSPPRTSQPSRECAICQSDLLPEEQTFACPGCGMIYHRECWEHNLGCAAYGCDQVNALAEKVADAPAPAAPPEPPPLPARAPLPWPFLLLGLAVLAMVVSSILLSRLWWASHE
jgi:predicted RNA-binding Zn-ribbon protein involved in translation (DUF1610 family)